MQSADPSFPPPAVPPSDLDFESAARRLRGVVRRTPLVPFDARAAGVELRLKLECLQEVGAFKARGAWNQVSQLTPAERARGVVCSSSGNHGQALAWAARRAGVAATIVMPADAYPNKIAACRAHGAEVVLCPTRAACEEEVARRVAAGAVLVHPYDAWRTIEGAGTVGLEIAEDWPEVEAVLVPTGGGGLVAGTALALRRALGPRVQVFAVEPEGAPTLTLALERGEPVFPALSTAVQGLCPPSAGRANVAAARAAGVRTILLADAQIFAAQARLVNEGGWSVEPAGAAAAAAVFSGALGRVLPRRPSESARRGPLRVCCVVSGGNPDPAQLESIRAAAAGAAGAERRRSP
jgi:threonine dehydratase